MPKDSKPGCFVAEVHLGFRKLVQTFQSAGIEIILDVAYSHTAEGNECGLTLCFPGLDIAFWYHCRLIAGQSRYYTSYTGCSNTLNVYHPYVFRMSLDSLRFWVQRIGGDGFRFDLVTTLGHENHGFDPNGGFLKHLGRVRFYRACD